MATSSVEKVNVDGSDMTLHTARPDAGGAAPAVIVIQEIFGVDPHIQDVTRRFADQGYFAVAPELFHRAGEGVVIPYAETQQAFGERGKLSNDDILADLNATVAYLRDNPNVDSSKIGIVGFCFGGFVSYLGAAKVDGITASAVFYGGGILPRPDAPADAPRMLDQTADSINVPMIGFWGDQDAGVGMENVETLAQRLEERQVDFRYTVYSGLGHGFMAASQLDPDHEAYEKACDAWTQTLDFYREKLGVAVAA